MNYQSINPATEEILETYETHTDAQAEETLEGAAAAFKEWRKQPMAQRAEMLRQAAGILEGKAGEWARLIASEMGKPLAQGEAEANKCALVCRHYADHAEEMLRPESRPSDASDSHVRYDALGPLLAIMPWNFPFWQLFRFAAPALAAGNVIIMKHAPSTPLCALAIEKIMDDAGFPEGVFQNLFLSNEQAGRLIADDHIRGVTLTGSTRAGKQVAASAGRNLKTMVMELGGSDAFIILEDADVEKAVKAAVEARCLNAGQSCIAAKRFLIHHLRYSDFRDAMVESMSSQVMGDPLEAGTQVGPMARRDLRDQLIEQVAGSVEAGARVLCGGSVPPGSGFYYPPTVLADIRSGTDAAEEELFGPVASLFPFATEEEAVVVANSTRYGLGASIWTADPERAARMIPDLEAGAVFVNSMVKSDPRLPFGGTKDSGFGRELGTEGIRSFCNAKTVWVR